MKRFTLLKTMLLLCALIVGSVNGWATDQSFTITIKSFSGLPTKGSPAYGTYNWSQGGVSGKGQIYADRSSTVMQMNGGNANGKIVYNTTAIPGSLKKINIIKASGSNRGYSVYGRTSAFSGSGSDYGTLIATANIADGSGRDYTVSSGDYNYFVIVCNPSSAAYLASITVTYDDVPRYTLYSSVSPAASGTVTLGATSLAEGKTTTITAAPISGYHFVNWTVSGTGASVATATDASTTFTMGSANATVTANFEINPAYTVTFGDGGSVTEASSNAGVTLPSRSSKADYSFVGWSETNLTSEVNDAPSIIPAGEYHPENNITLYPVYSRTESFSSDVTRNVSIEDYAAANSWENGKKNPGGESTSVINIDAVATATSGTGSNSGKYYTDGNSWRIYEETNGGFSLSVTTGYTLKSATFTYTNTNNGVLKYNSTNYTSKTSISLSGTSASFTVGHTSGSNNGNIRITAIEVTYVSPTTTYYTSSPSTTYDVTITLATWASFSSSHALDFTGTGVTAYIAKEKDADNVTLSPIQKVPANTGIVVSASADTYAIPVLSGDADATTGNLLKPWLAAGEPTEATYYVLGANAGNPIFKQSSGGTLAAGKSYLVLPGGIGARELNIGFEDDSETTGIQQVTQYHPDTGRHQVEYSHVRTCHLEGRHHPCKRVRPRGIGQVPGKESSSEKQRLRTYKRREFSRRSHICTRPVRSWKRHCIRRSRSRCQERNQLGIQGRLHHCGPRCGTPGPGHPFDDKATGRKSSGGIQEKDAKGSRRTRFLISGKIPRRDVGSSAVSESLERLATALSL